MMTLGKSDELTLRKSSEWENPLFIAVFCLYYWLQFYQNHSTLLQYELSQPQSKSD